MSYAQLWELATSWRSNCVLRSHGRSGDLIPVLSRRENVADVTGISSASVVGSVQFLGSGEAEIVGLVLRADLRRVGELLGPGFVRGLVVRPRARRMMDWSRLCPRSRREASTEAESGC